jgi:ADP-ribose pyrophosphatase YjhB (NUDIX family)
MTDGRLPYTYCPHCRGELQEETVFSRIRRVCPECGFIHFRDPKVGAGVLAQRNGKVVLVRRAVVPALGSWCLPSGFVEYDEGPEEAAIREFLEETGLKVRLTDLLDVRQYKDDTRGPGVVILYRGQIVGGEMSAGDDASEVGLFGPDELPDDIAFATHRQVLERWQEEVRRNGYSI